MASENQRFLMEIQDGPKHLKKANLESRETKVQPPDGGSSVQKHTSPKNPKQQRQADSDFPTQTKSFYHTYLLRNPPATPRYYLQYKFRPSKRRFQSFVRELKGKLKLRNMPRASLKENSLILWSEDSENLKKLKENFIVKGLRVDYLRDKSLNVDTSTLLIEGKLPLQDLEKLFVKFFNFNKTESWHPPTRITPEEHQLYVNSKEERVWPYVKEELRGFFTTRNEKQVVSINKEEEKKLFTEFDFKKQKINKILNWLQIIYGTKFRKKYLDTIAEWDSVKRTEFQRYFVLEGPEYWSYESFDKILQLSRKLPQKKHRPTKLKKHVCSQREGYLGASILEIKDSKFQECLYISFQQKIEECESADLPATNQWFGLEFVPFVQSDTAQTGSVTISEDWNNITTDLKNIKETKMDEPLRSLAPYCLKQPYVFKILGPGLENDKTTLTNIKSFFRTFIETWIENPAKRAKPSYEKNSFEDPSVQSWLVMDIWRFVKFFDGKTSYKIRDNIFFPIDKLQLPSVEYQLKDAKLTERISSWVKKLNKSTEIDPDEIVFVSKFLKYRNASEGEKGIQTYKRNRSVPFVPISYLSKKDYETLKKKLAEKLGSGKKNIPVSLDFMNDGVWQEVRNAANRSLDDSSKSSDDVDFHPDEWE